MRSRTPLRLALLLASVAGAVPSWFPSRFSPSKRPSTELSNYLRVQRLGIADSIHSMGTVACDGFRLAVHTWIPAHATATVFLVHGYYSQSGIWSEHIERLLGRGVAVVAFDLPGHGLSDGRRLDVDSFPQYAKALRAVEDSMRSRAPRPWRIAGHSLGGGVVLERARHGDFPYEKVILLAPLLRYHNWTRIGAALPAVALAKPYLTRKRLVGSSSDSAFRERILADPLEGWRTSTHWLQVVRRWNASLGPIARPRTSWTLVQGGLDQTIDWQWGTHWLRVNIPAIKVRWLPLARHHVHNEGGATGATARRILYDFMAPLPTDRK